ncbi:hypothetical protein ACI65C_006379 [Semiaphis heraclei]
MAGISQSLDGIPNAAPEESLLNSMLEEFFQYKHFKNTTQRRATAKILKRESDVIVSLPKGHGRTTCFLLPILICQKRVSIIFVGLSSRIEVQISRLKYEYVNVEILDAETSSEEWANVQNNIHNLCSVMILPNSILYVSLDVISSVDFSNLLNYLIKSNNLGYVVVDESYCENDWISGPKEEYHALTTLRNTISNIPWIITTAKASLKVHLCIIVRNNPSYFFPRPVIHISVIPIECSVEDVCSNTANSSKMLPDFFAENDELLIEEVRQNTVLYNSQDIKHKDIIYKDEIWKNIAGKVGKSIEDNNSDLESDFDVDDGDDDDESIVSCNNYNAGNMQLNRIYRCIPGVHDKSNIYVDNFQYKYYKKCFVRNKMYLICEKQRNKKINEYCPATAIIEIHDPENRIRLQSGGHNHSAVERDIDMAYLRRAVGRRATTLGAMSMPIRHIYNEEIIRYVQNFWLVQVGSELNTVYASEIRTNNYLELFHNQMLRFFGMHPNIWDFMQKLRILENQYFVDLFQARRNLTIQDQTSRGKRVVNSVFIRNSIEQLNEDYDVLKCLRSMGQPKAGYVRCQIGPPPSP